MFLVIAATAVACYGAVYATRLFKLRKEVARNVYLPPENHLSWTADLRPGSIPVGRRPAMHWRVVQWTALLLNLPIAADALCPHGVIM